MCMVPPVIRYRPDIWTAKTMTCLMQKLAALDIMNLYCPLVTDGNYIRRTQFSSLLPMVDFVPKTKGV